MTFYLKGLITISIFRALCYLRNRMQFIKNKFLCSHILSHLYDCPRSEFAVNRRYRCSRLHVIQQPTFLSHLKTIYRMISAVGAFSDDVVPLFRAHFMNFVSLRVAYKSEEHYEAIMSEFVYGSVPSIMVTYCEILLRVLYNFLGGCF